VSAHDAPVLLRAVARLLPAEFREEFGDELLAVAAQRVATGRRGVLAESFDLIRTVARERLAATRTDFAELMRGGGEPMGTLMRDIRYAVRMLWKTPVVSGIAAMSLALGIAATASMMALADGFLYSAIPWDEGGAVVMVNMRNPSQNIPSGGGVSAVSFFEIQESNAFAELALYVNEITNISEEGRDPEQIQRVVASPALLDIVRRSPAIGRGFAADDAADGAAPTTILMHDFWERRYGSDPGVIGRTVQIAGETQTIIGVMPEDFELIPANVQVLNPSNFDGQRTDHGRRYLVLGRLAEGMTLERASAEAGAIQEGVAELADPAAYEGWEAQVEWFRDVFPGETDTRLIQVMIAVSLFGLMIACANVANLLLGRAEQRQREVSVRTALGAGRGRIIRQMLTESVVLAAIAGAIGLGLATFLVDWTEYGMPAELPRALYPRLSPAVLILSSVVTLGAGVLFGLAPALHAVKGDLRDSLAGSRGGTAGRSRRRVRNAFVISEFAVALALLTGAGILVRAFQTITGGDSGFEAAGVMTFVVAPTAERYPDGPALQAFQVEAIQALEARPEISRAALMSQLPRARNGALTTYTIDGQDPPARASDLQANWMVTSPEFLAALDVQLNQGRFFDAQDAAETQPVAVVSQAFADRHFPDEDPLGQTIRLTRDQTGGAAENGREIIGVIHDVPMHRLEINARPSPAVYVPAAQVALRTMAFTVSAAGGEEGMARAIRDAILSVDPTLPVGSMKTMNTHVDEQLAGPRMIGTFVGAIGAIALLLAAMGIYGVMSHSVVQRTREIGIRMAMGAEKSSVIGMVARNGFSLVAVGLLAGVPLAWLMFRVTQSALGELTGVMSPIAPFLVVTVVLVAVAAVATLVPALRASTIRPAGALGSE
jgi:predicted permease